MNFCLRIIAEIVICHLINEASSIEDISRVGLTIVDAIPILPRKTIIDFNNSLREKEIYLATGN